jgi:N-acetylmuramoyl-L-alanine amidase
MALMPGATYLPVQNHGGAIGTIYGVVIHVQEGNNGLQGWFNNPASGVSAHFWVSKTGVLQQYVDTSLTAWAQGAGNANYLSVETEGFTTEPLPTAQISGFARIMVWAQETYGVPLSITDTPGDRGLITHGAGGVAWGNHPGCPGSIRAGQRSAIIQAAQPLPPGDEKMLVAFVPGSSKAYFCVTPNGAVWSYGGAVYKGGVNNAGPGGTSALPAGDSCTDLAVCAADGYMIATAQNNLYAFGSAQYSGKP